MKTMEIKVARIGNSRGVRLASETMKRYRFGPTLILEERSEGVLLRPAGPVVEKLDWEGTARAAAAEDWREWDSTAADGLDQLPWEAKGPGRIRENSAAYKAAGGTKKRSIKRYEIRWASLDPAEGAEMAKSRPVVIVSLDALNERLQTVTICPLTSRLHPAWRSRLQIRCATLTAEIAVDQIRTISRSRLGAKIGALTDDEASVLRRIITEMYGG